MSEASVDWGRIVVPKPASPVFMISHPAHGLSSPTKILEIVQFLKVKM